MLTLKPLSTELLTTETQRMHKEESHLDRVSTGSGSDLVSDQHAIS